MMVSILLFIFHAFVHCQPPGSDGGLISVDIETSRLVDEDGRERIFHGTNVVYKGAPYYPPIDSEYDTIMSFNEQDFEQLEAWGFNSVRLGLLWAGIEPKRDQFDEDYLQKMVTISEKMSAHGIYTLVNMHQDVMSEYFCGDGFPSWVIDTHDGWSFPRPLQITPYNLTNGQPSEEECAQHDWSTYYMSSAVGAAFQSLYDNYNGVRDQYAEMWREVASKFVGGSRVLGYDLMNEPWAGDVGANPTLLAPGVADSKNLLPCWEEIAKEIRKVDDSHSIHFESVTWDQTFSVGFDNVPGGEDYRNRSVLDYHFYKPPSAVGPDQYIKARMKDMQRLKCGGFLSEFATTWPVPTNTPFHDIKTTLSTVQAAQNATQGWTGWAYKVFHPNTGRHPMTPGTFSMFLPNGTLDVDLLSVLTQPYPKAVCGRTIFNYFDPVKRTFDLVYSHRICSLPTVIYFNEELHYSKGYEVDHSSDGADVYINGESKNHLIIKVVGQENVIVRITLKPK